LQHAKDALGVQVERPGWGQGGKSGVDTPAGTDPPVPSPALGSQKQGEGQRIGAKAFRGLV